MKIAHISDLHLGKTLNGHSLIEDQSFILEEIIRLSKEEKIEALLIAGDVYDRAIPPVEAITMFESFLKQLQELHIQTFVIAGNHDSAERLSYGSFFFQSFDIHLVGSFQGKIEQFLIPNGDKIIQITCLPYIRPSYINRFIDDEDKKVKSYSEAVRYAIETGTYEKEDCQIIMAHQFVVGSTIDENGSEELMIGGIDAIDGDVFELFDYVALGHIHRPQTVQKETMRYCGTPLKYSIGELNQTKSMTILEIDQDQAISISEIPLVPMRDMHEIHMYFDEVIDLYPYKDQCDDYMVIRLKDEMNIPDAIYQLRDMYPHILRLDYDKHEQKETKKDSNTDIEHLTPQAIFASFFEGVRNRELSDEQKAYLDEIIQDIFDE